MNWQTPKRQRGGLSRWNDAPPHWSSYGSPEPGGHARTLQLEGTANENLISVPSQNDTAGDSSSTNQLTYPSSLLGPLASFSYLEFPDTGLLLQPSDLSTVWSSHQVELTPNCTINGSTTPNFPQANTPTRWRNANGLCGSLPAFSPHDGGNLLASLNGDIWSDTPLCRLDGGLYPPVTFPVVNRQPFLLQEEGSEQMSSTPTQPAESSRTHAHLGTEMPPIAPPVSRKRKRYCDFIPNPFLDSSNNRHPDLNGRSLPTPPQNGVIDGYIKMQWPANRKQGLNVAYGRGQLLPHRRRQTVINPDDGSRLHFGIPLLPPNFSTGMRLSKTEEKLWYFHLHAFCPGRTLLPGNYWSDQVASIAVKDDCARHALFAFSTAYVLDYEPSNEMRMQANYHYRTAVQLLGKALQDEATYGVGREDAVVVAIILILSNDIVNWECRRDKDNKRVEPLWREGSRAARQLLNQTDPRQRYWKMQNVQSSGARMGNTNWIAYTEICAQPVTPLAEESTKDLFPWLLSGSNVDVRKIQDVTGVCPKLLHIFSQITHLAALLAKTPQSRIIPHAALKIRHILTNFWQWSDASKGYRSFDKLIESCVLDRDGKVFDPVKVTELSAHSWVPAAEMYLHMRVYRKPRSHPHVVQSLEVLVQCIKRLPCTGALFTSQSPFFPIFLMAVASYREADRRTCQDWFDLVLNGAQCRSSVPPVWQAIRRLWVWLDNDLKEDPYDEDQLIGDRRAWWEDMVEELVKQSGVLSLV